MGVRKLVKNMQKVDDTLCLKPVEEGNGKALLESLEIALDLTDLGKYVMHSGGKGSFEMKNARRGRKNRGLMKMMTWCFQNLFLIYYLM